MSDRNDKTQHGSSSSRRATRSSARGKQVAQPHGLKGFAGFKSIKASAKRGASVKDDNVTRSKKKAKVHTSTSRDSPVDLSSGDEVDVERKADIAFVDVNVPETEGKLPNSIFETVMYVSSQQNENKEAEERNEAYGPNPHKQFMAHKHKPSVLAHVLTQFDIPSDIERSSKYGMAFSGLCVEDRILVMFETGQLVPKGVAQVPAKTEQVMYPDTLQMCYSCGKKGHMHWECPSACD